MIHFDKASVLAEIAAVEAAAAHRPLYDEDNGPGLWLVGDQGVYLMGNDLGRDPEARPVVYAAEIDPTRLGFDEWWSAKQHHFGGDDGVEWLSLASVKDWAEHSPGPRVAMSLSPAQVKLMVERRP